MESLAKDKKIINDYCTKLGINIKVSNNALKVFREMHWDINEEVHVFAFITHLFLIDNFRLSIFHVCHYPENVIKVINTFKMEENTESLYFLLSREFSSLYNGDPIIPAVLTNFALTFSYLWKRNINNNFI